MVKFNLHPKPMRNLIIFFILLLSLFQNANGQSSLQAGPMIGYVDYREACVWLQTREQAVVSLKYYTYKDGVYESNEVITRRENAFTAKLILDKVEPGNTYQYEIWINGKPDTSGKTYTLKVPALWKFRVPAPNFKFAMGSCHYALETQYDRPGRPYGDTDQTIFGSIVTKNPDFMLWLGDNIYLREPDWNSATGIYKRYTHMRSNPELQKLLEYCPNYAIWDDHDFGPNDADRSFWNKQATLQAFKDFWANPGFGVNGQPGITTFFQWNDADFFLLDDRYFKSPNKTRPEDGRTILGKEQLQWLKDALLYSDARFKFIALGGQFLNTAAVYENYSTVPAERQEIIDFIYRNKIKNVIFLTGDRHHAEISLLKRDSLPAIYDITASPLTSGPSDVAEKEINTLRLDSSLVTGKRNFATIEVSGDKENRKATVIIFDKFGGELYRKEIVPE